MNGCLQHDEVPQKDCTACMELAPDCERYLPTAELLCVNYHRSTPKCLSCIIELYKKEYPDDTRKM